MPINVLVSGLNGTVAQSILKALKASGLSITTFGCDISPYGPGLYRVDQAFLVPPYTHPDYEAQIIELLASHRIDCWLPGVEAELVTLAARREVIERATGCRIFVNSPEVLAITQDKYLTACWLAEHGCSFPRSTIHQDLDQLAAFSDEVGFPLVVKPRRGSASRHVYVVQSAPELEYWLEKVPDPVVQEYLGTPDEEYTCGAFVDARGELKGVATLRRSLANGSTANAISLSVPDVEAEVARIVTALGVRGSCNVQLRRNKEGFPTAFEINARFSSSVSIRAHFGFNEVEATLRSFLLGEELPRMTIRSGVAMRYVNEVYIERHELQSFKDTGEHRPQSTLEANF